MTSFAEELVEINNQGAAAVLATVVETTGNVTVAPGAKCLVRDGKVLIEDYLILELIPHRAGVLELSGISQNLRELKWTDSVGWISTLSVML